MGIMPCRQPTANDIGYQVLICSINLTVAANTLGILRETDKSGKFR
jgi:hypothetical protein